MLTSKLHLIKYIRSQLGEPLITVDVTDDQISTVIDDTIRQYAEVVYGDFEDAIIIDGMDVDSLGKISLPRFNNILQVSPLGADYCPVVGYPVLPQPERKGYPYRWNNINRTLTILLDPVPSKMLVVGLSRYKANEEHDYIYDETWVKEMSKWQTQKLWGHIVGKFSQNLVGGATINYDRLISEAQTEIDRLMEDLNDKWIDPAPVMVG